MTPYFVYEISTGAIKKTGTCQESTLHLMAGPGEAVGIGLASASMHYVDGDSLVAFPPRPAHHAWDWAGKCWVANLAEARASKWEQIKQARESAEFGGFSCDGRAYDSDLASVQRIGGAVSMAMIAAGDGEPFSIDWTLADNAVVSLTGEEMISVGMALGAHVSDVHARARSLRAQIEGAATIEQVNAIAWSVSTE